VDLIAFNLLESVCLKQKLLSEANPRQRAVRVVSALQAIRPEICCTGTRSSADASRN
jgi:hypothetical protein